MTGAEQPKGWRCKVILDVTLRNNRIPRCVVPLVHRSVSWQNLPLHPRDAPPTIEGAGNQGLSHLQSYHAQSICESVVACAIDGLSPQLEMRSRILPGVNGAS